MDLTSTLLWLTDAAPSIAIVLSGCVAALVFLRKRLSRWRAFWRTISDGLQGLPQLRDDVRGIRYYVAPNGGGSLSDSIARTESAVRTLTEKTDLMMQTAWAERDADDEVAQFHCCGPTGETLYVNQLYARWLGVGKSELLGWGWLNFVHPDDVARVSAEWEICRAQHRVYRSRHRLVAVDGEVIDAQVVATPIPDAPPAKRWIGSIKRVPHDRRKTDATAE